jgi:hypothetical protein
VKDQAERAGTTINGFVIRLMNDKTFAPMPIVRITYGDHPPSLGGDLMYDSDQDEHVGRIPGRLLANIKMIRVQDPWSEIFVVDFKAGRHQAAVSLVDTEHNDDLPAGGICVRVTDDNIPPAGWHAHVKIPSECNVPVRKAVFGSQVNYKLIPEEALDSAKVTTYGDLERECDYVYIARPFRMEWTRWHDGSETPVKITFQRSG